MIRSFDKLTEGLIKQIYRNYHSNIIKIRNIFPFCSLNHVTERQKEGLLI